jgi:hypothetical protein
MVLRPFLGVMVLRPFRCVMVLRPFRCVMVLRPFRCVMVLRYVVDTGAQAHLHGHRQSIVPSFTDTMFRAAREGIASVCVNQIAPVHGAGTHCYTHQRLMLQTRSLVTPEPCLCHMRVIVWLGMVKQRSRRRCIRLVELRVHAPSATNYALWISKFEKSQKQHTALVARELTQAPVTSVVRVLRVETGAGYPRVGALRVGSGPGTLQSQTFIHQLSGEAARGSLGRASGLRKTTGILIESTDKPRKINRPPILVERQLSSRRPAYSIARVPTLGRPTTLVDRSCANSRACDPPSRLLESQLSGVRPR